MKKAYVCNNGQAECFLSAAHAAALKFLFILHPLPSSRPKRRFRATPVRIRGLLFLILFFWTNRRQPWSLLAHGALARKGVSGIFRQLLEASMKETVLISWLSFFLSVIAIKPLPPALIFNLRQNPSLAPPPRNPT
jgi:hypothetical protein